MSTVRRYLPQDELDIWPPEPEGGFVHHMPVFNMKGGMARMYQYTGYFTQPDSLSALSLGTQMAQATGIRHTLELARTRWPAHTGVCYYKVNDNNPAASWSSVDWFGTTKIAYHVLKQAYRPLHPCVIFDSLNFVCMDVTLPVHILDEHNALDNRSWVLSTRIFNSNLNLVQETEFKGRGCVSPNTAVGELKMPAKVTQSIPLLLVATLQVADDAPIQTYYWLNFESGQNALFDLPTTNLEIERGMNSVVVKNTGDNPAVGVFFEPENPDRFVCQEAYFWLDVGENRKITTNQPDTVRVSAWNSQG
jgi:beta-mannosidase